MSEEVLDHSLRALLTGVLRGGVAEDGTVGGDLERRVCRVCLGRATDPDALARLEDTCNIQTKPCAGTYLLSEILSYVMRTKPESDGIMPGSICQVCVQSCVEAFIFMKTYELNTKSLEKCVDFVTYNLNEEIASDQERVIVTILPQLHDYKIFDDLKIQNVKFDKPDQYIQELCWAKYLKPELKMHECTMCERSFTTKLLLRQHEFLHPVDSKHICRLCGAAYKQRRILNRHIHDKHANEDQRKLLCVLCGNTFPTAYSLFCHQAVEHGAPRLFYCSACYFRSKSEDNIQNHIKTIHPDLEDAHYSVLEPNDELTEEVEDNEAKGVKQVAELQTDAEGNQIQVVRYIKPKPKSRGYTFMCDLCMKVFTRVSQLRKHIEREHTNMQCKDCGKRFRIKRRYEAHCEMHKDTPDLKIYKCDYCDYSAKQRRLLITHTTRRHTNIRPFQCEICGKGFIKLHEVRMHMIVHTRERPAVCTLCDKRFVSKAALIYHTRLHTGEKPYECGVCGEKFLSASRRGAHIRSKHGPRPQCMICNSTYTNNQVLQKHIRNVHMKHTSELSSRVKKVTKKQYDMSPQYAQEHQWIVENSA